MGFELLLGDLGIRRLVEEGEEQLQLLLFSAFGYDRDKVDELVVVHRGVKGRTVLDHEEELIGQVGVVDFHQAEVL